MSVVNVGNSQGWRRGIPPFIWIQPLIVATVAGLWTRSLAAAAWGAGIGAIGLGFAVWIAHFQARNAQSEPSKRL